MLVAAPVNEQFKNLMFDVVPFKFTFTVKPALVFENLIPSNSKLLTPFNRSVQLLVAAVAPANVTFTGNVFDVADLNVTLLVALVPVMALMVTCSV